MRSRPRVLSQAGLCALATLFSALAPTWLLLVISRCVLGFGVGLSFTVVPLYVAECVPASMRGRVIDLSDFAVVLGQLCSGLINGGAHSVVGKLMADPWRVSRAPGDSSENSAVAVWSVGRETCVVGAERYAQGCAGTPRAVRARMNSRIYLQIGRWRPRYESRNMPVSWGGQARTRRAAPHGHALLHVEMVSRESALAPPLRPTHTTQKHSRVLRETQTWVRESSN